MAFGRRSTRAVGTTEPSELTGVAASSEIDLGRLEPFKNSLYRCQLLPHVALRLWICIQYNVRVMDCRPNMCKTKVLFDMSYLGLVETDLCLSRILSLIDEFIINIEFANGTKNRFKIPLGVA